VSRARQRVFQETLVELGVEKARADDLTEDTLSHAVDAGQDPHLLFGPAHAYARHLLDTLQDVPDPKEDTRLAVRGPQVLVLAQVTKRYRRRVVLDGVDLTVRAGEVAAVVGANGSGKSTLLNGTVKCSTERSPAGRSSGTTRGAQDAPVIVPQLRQDQSL
jgi:ABC-2 type transport system ATP-binding protein